MKFNKALLIITSILVLIPILVGALTWDILPEEIATHWGADGMANDWSSRAFAVFGLPMILLVIHWVCIIITAADHRKKEQNKKAYNMVLFITPIISWFVNALMYAMAFGLEFNIYSLIFGLLGIMFTVVGNYMPKISQNHTLGIKISWTLQSEANWNATHRVAGKVWVVTGLIALICVFIPAGISAFIMPVILVAAIVIPTVYSYKFYLKEKKEGKTFMKNKKLKKYYIISGIIVAVILLVIGFIMFSGSIEITYTDDGITVDSSYADPLSIKYSDMTAVWYSEEYIEGKKVLGFNSAKLLVGIFNNEALENYNRYTYTGNNAFVVIETTDAEGEEHYTVLGGKSFAETAEIYKKLSGIASFELEYDDKSLTVTPSRGEPVTVDYSTVGSTQYRESYIEDNLKNGFETNDIMIGEFRNEEFGKHKRFTYLTDDAYIIIEILDEEGKTDSYVMLNADGLEATRELYNELSEIVVG